VSKQWEGVKKEAVVTYSRYCSGVPGGTEEDYNDWA